jgi:hypothetical protein
MTSGRTLRNGLGGQSTLSAVGDEHAEPHSAVTAESAATRRSGRSPIISADYETRDVRRRRDARAAHACQAADGVVKCRIELSAYPLFQQAYLVADVHRSVHDWHRLFGAGPFVITPHHRTDRFDYRGTEHEADVSYAFGYLGDMMIQLIEQHDETPSIYRDMFAPGTYGFHHVAYLVHDFDAEFARLSDMGFECATRLYADGVDAAYFDTRSVTGCFTEIHGDPPRILEAFAQWRRAHELAKPGDSPLLVRPRSAASPQPETRRGES